MIEEIKKTESEQLTIDSINEKVQEALKVAEKIKAVFIVCAIQQAGQEVAAVISCGRKYEQLKLAAEIVPVAANETAKKCIKNIMGPLEDAHE